MRILVISNLYPDDRQPTFGTFVRTHVEALREAGADVRVVAIQGVDVHTAVWRKYLRLFWDSLMLLTSSILARRPPQIVEAHIAYPTGVIAWPLARFAGARLVLYVHGSDVHEVGRRSRVHHQAARFIFARADLLAVNSTYTQQSLAAGYGVALARVVVWSPGIDTRVFHAMPGIMRDAGRVLYVGRLDVQKGVDVLLRAMADLGEAASLQVIGDGPARQSLEREAESLGMLVQFDGMVRPLEVARAMAGAGVLAVPSAYAEGLGLVAIEGMAVGTLVVASRTGGLAETVEHGRTGLLAAPGDPGALADALRAALALAGQPESEKAAAIRAAAVRRAAEHDVRAIAAQVLDRYREMANRPTGH